MSVVYVIMYVYHKCIDYPHVTTQFSENYLCSIFLLGKIS